MVCPRKVVQVPSNSEVTKSHSKGDDDIKFSIDRTEAIKMKLTNSLPSQANVRIVEIE